MKRTEMFQTSLGSSVKEHVYSLFVAGGGGENVLKQTSLSLDGTVCFAEVVMWNPSHKNKQPRMCLCQEDICKILTWMCSETVKPSPNSSEHRHEWNKQNNVRKIFRLQLSFIFRSI